MAWSAYSLSLFSPAGVFVCPITTQTGLTYARAVNQAGSATITLPYTDAVWNAAVRNSILEIWRRGERGGMKRALGAVWFLNKGSIVLDSQGAWTMQLSFADQIDLLNRQIVNDPYSSATAQKYQLPAETIMKQVVSNELITRSGLGSYIAIEPDSARGYATISIICSYQSVASVCQQVCQASTQYGSYLAFDLEPQGPLSYVFRVYPNQRGTDRSAGSSQPLILSPQGGTVGTGTYAKDYSSIATRIIAAGQTTAGDPTTQTVTDANLEASGGPFGITEQFASIQNTADYGTITTQANQALRKARPMLSFTGGIIQTPGCEFGVDFDYGDLITVQFRSNLAIPVRLEGMSVSLDGTGMETITANMAYQSTS